MRFYFAVEPCLWEVSYVVQVLILRALMTRKSFAVGMRNVILRNHVKNISYTNFDILKFDQLLTLDLSTRLWGINTEIVGLISQGLVLRQEIIKVRE